MKLNRTGSNWTRTERNKINENWDILEGSYNDVAGEITDEVFKEIVDSAKINWKEPVDSFGDLPSGANEGETRMVRDTGKVYRFDGNNWIEIQDIDPTAINEVDSRLTQQLAETATKIYVDSLISKTADGAPKEVFESLQELENKYPDGKDGVMLVFDESFNDGAHIFIFGERDPEWLDITFTWRLGGLNTNNGKPYFGSTTRVRNLEYTYLSKGKIGLLSYSNYKFMVFKYSSDNDDSFMESSTWLKDDYSVKDEGYYRILIAYDDDRDIDESEVGLMGNLLRIQGNIGGWIDFGVYQATGIKDKSVGVEKLNEYATNSLLQTTKTGNSMDWKIGSFNTGTGMPTIPDNVVTRIRTLEYTHVRKGNLIRLSDYLNYKFMVFYYSEPKDSTFLYSTNWLNKDHIVDKNAHVKILIAFFDDREISEGDKVVLKNSLIIKTSFINNSIILDKSISESKLTDELKNKIDYAGSGSGYYFRGPTIPTIPVGENALKYNDFISQTWETLRAKYPEYITRNFVIKDTSDTFDIYEYVFEPEKYKKTVFLTAGIHGDEYEGFWGLYHFMKYISDKYYEHAQLRDLRHNVRFVVIPVLNPWGVENKTRATSRVSNANNNYDVFYKAPEYEDPAGEYAFSENEALAVKLVADKYNADFDFYADFHTDPYNPEYGNYMLANQLSSTFNTAKELTIDEINYLEEKYGFVTTPRSPNLVGVNRRSSSFKYMEAVRGVPSAILEVGTGRLSPIGSSTTMTVGVDWYTNIITEMLKHDLTQPTQAKNALEKAILENRFEGYSHSVSEKIPDENIQVFLDVDGFDGDVWENKAQRGEIEIVGLNASSKTENGILFNNSKLIIPERDYDDFTLVIKGTVNQQGMILTSDGELMLQAFTRADDSGRYNIYNGDERLMCSALRYGEEVTFGVKSVNGRLYLYVNGEPFNDIPAIHSTESQLFIGANNDLSESIDMSLKSLALYDRALKDDELGFVFKSFILQ